jgi:hypothetical protein
MAEFLGFGEVNIAYREVISLGQLGRQIAGQISHDVSPLALCRLILADPKAPRQPHFDLIFSRPALGLTTRAAHQELARLAPAKSDPGDLAFIPRLFTIKR